MRTKMNDASRPVSLGLFVLVLLCFLLPFARITCNKTEVVQATGYEVAFGKTIPAQPDTTGGKASWKERPATPDFLAILCLVAALVGIGLVIVRGRRGAIVRAIYSGHCLLLPLALWVELEQRAGSAQLQMLAGFWVTLALFAAACVVNLLAIRRMPRAAP
jgi:hypothetical protein